MKVEPGIARLLWDVFNPPSESKVLKPLHELDKKTKWFGVRCHHGDSRRILQDYGRYATLMMDLTRQRTTNEAQYPQLVSFIGVTNAGKSTLVKLLMLLMELQSGVGKHGVAY